MVKIAPLIVITIKAATWGRVQISTAAAIEASMVNTAIFMAPV